MDFEISERHCLQLPGVKERQDAINENLQRLQEFRDNEPNPLGKGKVSLKKNKILKFVDEVLELEIQICIQTNSIFQAKHLAAVTSTHQAVETQQAAMRLVTFIQLTDRIA